MTNLRSTRFKDFNWYKPGTEAIVLGAGGIGSWISLLLTRQEFDLTIYDHDLVEEHNLGGQLYSKKDIGLNKAIATNEILRDFCGAENTMCCGKYEEDSMISEIMFSCFDNMAARKLAFSKWSTYLKECINKGEDLSQFIFIDGRMLAEAGQIYFVTLDKIEEYEKTLFDDSEVPDLLCSLKATSHCAAIIAGMMVSGLNNHMFNRDVGKYIREVPFSIVYELPTFNFEINGN